MPWFADEGEVTSWKLWYGTVTHILRVKVGVSVSARLGQQERFLDMVGVDWRFEIPGQVDRNSGFRKVHTANESAKIAARHPDAREGDRIVMTRRVIGLARFIGASRVKKDGTRVLFDLACPFTHV